MQEQEFSQGLGGILIVPILANLDRFKHENGLINMLRFLKEM